MGLLTHRDPLMRSRGFGPILGAAAAGAGAAAGGGGMSMATLGALLSGGGTVLGAIGGLGDNSEEENAKKERKLSREEILIQLLMRDAQTRQRNTALDATTPIKQMLLNKVLGGTPGGLETANAMPRTYQSAVPGQASLTPPTQSAGKPDFLGRPTQQTQYGAPADPQALAGLVPNFSQRRMQQFGEVQALTSQITADKFKGEEIIPKLNDFSLTQGAYTFSDKDPRLVSGKEILELAATNPGAPVQGRFQNVENDQLDDVEVQQLNDMIARGEPAGAVAAKYQEFLNTRLDGGR